MFARIDWQAPWLRPWAAWGQPLAAQLSMPHQPAVAELLNHAKSTSQLPPDWAFVPQAQLPKGVAYEAFIFEHHQIPTRDNLHDFFNGLCWLRFPRSKQRLNQLQAQAIAEQGVQSQRGALRDALTLFDENAVLLQGPPQLLQALAAHDWDGLFVQQRGLWVQAQVDVFGHALLEKLVQPFVAITGHVWQPPPATLPSCAGLPWSNDPLDSAAQDAALCAQLSADWMRRKPYAPLPVLGIPGWWAANAQPAFYANTTVFRRAKKV